MSIANGIILAAYRTMTKSRHSLALLALSLVACFSETPWETGQGWSVGSASSRGPAPATDHAAANPVDWSTLFVSLHADDFRIAVGGKTFLGKTSEATLNSDPGTPDAYTTLERVWIENNVEMRLFMYFHSDGTDWWASEIRIYDGQQQGDWLIATGEWFKRPLGQSFTGDLDLTLAGQGHLTMHGLKLQAFTKLEGCNAQSSGYAIEVLYPTIEMTNAPNTGFGVSVWLLNHCEHVDDTSDFAFVWTVDDPKLVELSSFVPESSNIQLKGLAAGKTTLRVTVQRRSGEVVAPEATMEVIITSAQGN